MINLKSKSWEIQNINTGLFDKDGTFIDLHYFWGKMTELRVNEIIKHFQLNDELFSELCLALGYNLNSQKMLSDGITALYSRKIIIEIFCKDLKNFGLNTTEKEVEKIFDKVNNTFYEQMTEYTKPIIPAINFIKELRKNGVKTGIVTSDSKISTDLTLKHFGWVELFDVVIGRESTNETKESGIPVKTALKLINVKPENTVMIGDAPMDYLAAKNAGVEKTILAATGQLTKNELLKTSKYVVDSLEDIQIFKQN